MNRFVLGLLATIGFLGAVECRPSLLAPTSVFPGIIGGTDATPGEFPWQLSQQRLGSTWSHSCGASLLSSTKVLSAAHCVDGTVPSVLRVIAGLHKRSDTTGTQTSAISNFVIHENYENDAASSANDIAILHLSTPITTGANIQFATLPADNSNDLSGTTCIVSGWGRDSNANTLPDVLQKANMRVLTTAQCTLNLQGVGNANVWANQICVQDPAGNSGSCNGDSGGPLNCPSGSSTVVAGVASWVVANLLGNCLPAYPSVYTRTSAYLAWINSN